MNDERMMTSASSAMIRPKNATLLPKMALSSVGESETVRAVAPVMNAEVVDESTQKIALLGSLTLYLDFINLFLYLLRILGSRK